MAELYSTGKNSVCGGGGGVRGLVVNSTVRRQASNTVKQIQMTALWVWV